MAVQMLIVDDEPDLELLIKQKFRREIRDGLYRFEYAENGKKALEKISANSNLEIILTDINMPEMDGLTLLVNMNIVNPIAKAVIISAYGDMANIRTAMNNGAFDFLTKPIDFDDLEITIQKTIKYVEQLKKSIQSIRENNILKMYVDPNVIHFMANQELEKNLLRSEKVEATVMFVDIVGFTAISEKNPADEVVNMLNDCFDAMVKLIMIEDGYVDKFIGDAVMAVFRNEDHLKRAVKCACKIRDRMHTSGKFKVSIGINSGTVVSGNIGSQSLKRLDYTLIGDVVNTASRFQNAADAWQVLIKEDALKDIMPEFKTERIGEFNLKNKEKPVVLFNVISKNESV